MHDKFIAHTKKKLRNQCRSSYDLRTSYFLLAHDFIMHEKGEGEKVSQLTVSFAIAYIHSHSI